MLAGSLFVTFCLFTLAWASEIVRLVVKDEEKVGIVTIFSNLGD